MGSGVRVGTATQHEGLGAVMARDRSAHVAGRVYNGALPGRGRDADAAAALELDLELPS